MLCNHYVIARVKKKEKFVTSVDLSATCLTKKGSFVQEERREGRRTKMREGKRRRWRS